MNLRATGRNCLSAVSKGEEEGPSSSSSAFCFMCRSSVCELFVSATHVVLALLFQMLQISISSVQSWDQLGRPEGRFSKDPVAAFSAGGCCEQFWHGWRCPDITFSKKKSAFTTPNLHHSDLLQQQHQ